MRGYQAIGCCSRSCWLPSLPFSPRPGGPEVIRVFPELTAPIQLVEIELDVTYAKRRPTP